MQPTVLTRESFQGTAAGADHKAGYLTDRYSFVSTGDILEGIEDLGWVPTSYSQVRTKKAERIGFQKHQIRLRQISDVELHKAGRLPVGAVIPELRWTNSHDGLQSVRTDGGFFRLACLNGLVVADSAVSCQSIRHTESFDEVMKVIRRMAESVREMGEIIPLYKEIQLPADDVLLFAEAASVIRERYYGSRLIPESLLKTRRMADSGDSLWNVFNRIEENVIRGGADQMSINRKTNKPVVRKSRGVKNITVELDLNKDIWQVMDHFKNGEREKVLEIVGMN